MICVHADCACTMHPWLACKGFWGILPPHHLPSCFDSLVIVFTLVTCKVVLTFILFCKPTFCIHQRNDGWEWGAVCGLLYPYAWGEVQEESGRGARRPVPRRWRVSQLYLLTCVYSLLLHVYMYQHVVELPACGHHRSLFRSLEFPNG